MSQEPRACREPAKLIRSVGWVYGVRAESAAALCSSCMWIKSSVGDTSDGGISTANVRA